MIRADLPVGARLLSAVNGVDTYVIEVYRPDDIHPSVLPKTGVVRTERVYYERSHSGTFRMAHEHEPLRGLERK